MQRARQRRPAEPGLRLTSRGQDGHVEPVLQRGVPGHAEPVQQAAVGRAAAEEDVLAGVDGQAVPAERAGRAAQPRPGLEQGDVGARLGERDRGGDPGQSPADHRDASPRTQAHLILPARARTATMAFSRRGQRNPAVQDGGGLRRDPLEQPAVDAGHGAGAGRAAAVEHGQQLPAGGVPFAGPFGLEFHQPDELGRAGCVQVDVELGQVLGGQVDPPVLVVLADVAQDVGQLQGDAERVGQAGRLLLVVAV